ncbi:MAG: hypothetical protein R3A51_06305 [Nannocystaceae bacterium]|nr:hypothetical protein [Myxococcales bacterium]
MGLRARAAAVGLSIGLGLACGDDVVTAELAEVCGQPSPLRLLELGADELPLAIQAIDDRIYYVVGPRERGDDFGAPGTWDEGPATATVYSTGRCGEDRVEIARDVWRVFTDERMPGLLLGCSGTHEHGALNEGFNLVALDPAGVEPPRLLIPGACSLDWTDYGVVVEEEYDEHVARVLLYPYVDGLDAAPITPIVLLESVQSGPQWGTVEPRAAEVLAVDLDGQLVRVDLSDGSLSILEVGVHSFMLSVSGRYVQWFPPPPAADDDAATPVHLLDREAGVTHLLADAAYNHSCCFLRDDFAILDVAAATPHERLVSLSTLVSVDVPADRSLMVQADDGRWVTASGWGWDAPLQLRELSTGAEETILEDGQWLRVDQDHLDALLVPRWSSETGELQRIPYDGAPPRVLARRATTGYLELEDGRVVTAVDLDADHLGVLTVTDADTRDGLPIDDRVFATVGSWNQGAPLGAAVVIYAVSDGARSGVYAAHLAPGQ